MIGTTLAGYRVIEQVGKGGMATVYKAFDPSTERYVAIKTLPDNYLNDDMFRARFEQEAKAIAQLEHIHILPMFSYGEENGVVYMVMRYLDTGTLADYMQMHGAFSLTEASKLLGQIASALHYAHENNILHRDVKPSNILIDNQGNALLTDFGIAKMIDGSGLDLTGTGLIGTPKYMSPEQCKGEKVLTPLSDQYSLGIILYEMITGQAPFDAETPLAVIQQHVNAPLPLPRKLRPDLPEVAQNVMLKALARDAQARYISCEAFAEGFSQTVANLENSTDPTSHSSLIDEQTVVPTDNTTATQEDSTLRPRVANSNIFKGEPRTHRKKIFTTLSLRKWVILFIVFCGISVVGILLKTDLINNDSDTKSENISSDDLPIEPSATDNAQAELIIESSSFGAVLFEDNWDILQNQSGENEEVNWVAPNEEASYIEARASRENNLIGYLGDDLLLDSYLRFQFLPRTNLQSGALLYVRAVVVDCQRYEIQYERQNDRLAQLHVWRIEGCTIEQMTNLGVLEIPPFRQHLWYEIQLYILGKNIVLSVQDLQGANETPYQMAFLDENPLDSGLTALVVSANQTFWYRTAQVQALTLNPE